MCYTVRPLRLHVVLVVVVVDDDDDDDDGNDANATGSSSLRENLQCVSQMPRKMCLRNVNIRWTCKTSRNDTPFRQQLNVVGCGHCNSICLLFFLFSRWWFLVTALCAAETIRQYAHGSALQSLQPTGVSSSARALASGRSAAAVNRDFELGDNNFILGKLSRRRPCRQATPVVVCDTAGLAFDACFATTRYPACQETREGWRVETSRVEPWSMTEVIVTKSTD